jgi:hypothetical protein
VACEITFESWVQADESEMAGLRLATSTAAAELTGVESLYLDIYPAELAGGYAHVAIRAVERELRLAQWGELHTKLGSRVAVSKLTIWVPYAIYEHDAMLVSAEQLVRDMGYEPHTWSDRDDEVKISQRPVRLTRPGTTKSASAPRGADRPGLDLCVPLGGEAGGHGDAVLCDVGLDLCDLGDPGCGLGEE